ncbi:hypothetical protein HY571_02635 [Candidatus Micrarchaeota archaeon]|nr:hypothetical protein [Candidatus Micrarchaeota archaeon]
MLTIPKLHRLVGLGLKSGLVRASDWMHSKEKISRYAPNSIYRTICNIERNGKPFIGHGNWYAYLENQHGVSRPEMGSGFRGKRTSSPEELKELIRRIIEETYEKGSPAVAASDWRASQRVVCNRTLGAVFQEASNWKVGGKGFGGYGRWHVFLEKEFGITPVYHRPWSDERFHRTIAMLAEKHHPKKVIWKYSQEPVLHGRTLQAFYQCASVGNRRSRPREKNPWFGQRSFKAYIEWAKKNYGTGSAYVEKT